MLPREYLLGTFMRERIFVIVALLLFFLSPTLIQALDIDVELGYGQFCVAHRNANNGWRIEGTYLAESTIEFAICDVGNYSKWLNNQTPSLYEHYEVTSHSFNFTIRYNGEWYVIFSNTYSSITTNLNAKDYYIDQFGTTQTQITMSIQSSIITPVLIGFIVIIAGLCLLGIWFSRRRERQPAVRYEDLLSVPE
jgi:hypothetical protein